MPSAARTIFAAIDAVEAAGQSIHRLAFRRFSS
jgi:hypothetical protein